MKTQKFYRFSTIVLFTTTLFLSIFSLEAQQAIKELDENYLQSLPESIRKDILAEQQKMNESDSKSLKSRPSSELLKLDVINEWEEFQRSREYDSNKSERYGINLFRSMQSSFMPINEPNFGDNYALDYGDVLQIEVFSSSFNKKYVQEIQRDGSINLSEIGPVNLAGLSFIQAINLITNKYKNSFIGAEVAINLEKIRDIKVLVTGNVEFPGIYTLSGNSNILQALNIAGGVKENGTLRDIEQKRGGKTIQAFDLYESLIFGDISNISNLQSGDSIYVKPSKNLVRAGSGFNNQSIYELKDNESLEDLVKFSGGVDKSVYETTYTLLRTESGETKTISLEKSELQDYKVKHLDSLYLPLDNFGSVEIRGEVKRPGKYTISGDDDLYDIIVRAGGYTKAAYPFGGILKTEKARKLEVEFIQKTYNSIIQYVAQNPSRIGTSEGLPYLLNEIKNIDPSGRVSTEFDLIELKNNPLKRRILNDKDEIHIPKNDNNIYVYGAVGNPGAISFSDKFEVENYIASSGGLNVNADKSNIYVVNPDGTAYVVSLSRGLNNILKSKEDIYPGSLIYVPQNVGSVRGVEFYSTIAPIFSSLALSIASLNSISD